MPNVPCPRKNNLNFVVLEAMNQPSPFAAAALKTVGTIFIVSSIIDAIVLAIPQPGQEINKQWQLAYTTQLVDKGIIPLLGLALLFTGVWISSSAGLEKPSRSALLDGRLWALLFSVFLGVAFLVLFPLHLNNVRLLRREALDRAAQEAQVQENQLQAILDSNQAQENIKQRQQELKEQIPGLIEDEERLNQVLDSDRTPQWLKQLLQNAKDNPTEINKFVDERFNRNALKEERLNEIRTARQEQEDRAKMTATKSAAQTGISSLLLSIGFSVVGWTGLRGFGGGGRRKKSR